MNLKKILKSLFKNKDETVNLDFTDVKINLRTEIKDLPEFREKKFPEIPKFQVNKVTKAPPANDIPPFVPPSEYAKRAEPSTPPLPDDATDPSFNKTMNKMKIIDKDVSKKGYDFDDTDLKLGDAADSHQENLNPPKFPNFNPDDVPALDHSHVTTHFPLERTSMFDRFKASFFPKKDDRPAHEDRTFAGGDGTVILRGALKPEGKKILSRPVIYFLLLIGLGLLLKSLDSGEKVANSDTKESKTGPDVTKNQVEKKSPLSNPPSSQNEPRESKRARREAPRDSSGINFASVGSGLVYNCQGKHWSCVDAANYELCGQIAQQNGRCQIIRSFSSNRECSTAQQDKVNSGFLVDFCP